MRRRAWHCIAAVSLLTVAAHSNLRPHYGGTLRVEVGEALSSYDPARASALEPGDALRQHLAALLFDRLVVLDAHGQPQPALATSWEHDSDLRRWVLHLRGGVKLHDGNPLSARLVVASIAAGNPPWRTVQEGNDVVIESPEPRPNLLAELACTRNAIVAHAADGTPIGTGPFKMQNWQPGFRAVLVANEDYWSGRPFVQSIDLLMGRALRDQALDFRLDRADLIELAPDEVRRALQEGQRTALSAPVDLIGIVFPPDSGPDQGSLRATLSLAVDRSAIQTAILQRQGEAAGGLLPQWVSGYAFLFPVSANLERARQQRSGSTPPRTLQLAFDAGDPVMRAVAERVAVNARDAGILLQTFAETRAAHAPASALRMVRFRVPSGMPAVALAALAAALDRQEASTIASGASLDQAYASERALLESGRLVPLVFCTEAHSLGPRIRNWEARPNAEWTLENVWLQPETP